MNACPLDALRSVVESALQDEATKAAMEEKLLAASGQVGKQVAAALVSDAAETNRKTRADCTQRRKRKVAQVWPAEFEPFLDQIQHQLLEGPFTEGPRLAWETLLDVMMLTVNEWEQGEEPEEEDLEWVEDFHERADELLCSIWRAQRDKGVGQRGRPVWDWIRATDKRLGELEKLQEASAWGESRYVGIYSQIEDGDYL